MGREEIQGFMKNATFELVAVDYIRNGMRIFGSKLIHIVKPLIIDIRYKSRFDTLCYGDEDLATFAAKVLTVQRFCPRLFLSPGASLDNMSCYARSYTQAYTKSVLSLEREIYVSPPIEYGFPTQKVLKVVKPPYGIPNSGPHRYTTYVKHHTQRLGLSRSRADPYLLYRQDGDYFAGMVIL